MPGLQPIPEAEKPPYGSLDSLHLKEREFRDLYQKCEQTAHELIKEFDEAMYNIHPVLRAIKMAVEGTDGTSDSLS